MKRGNGAWVVMVAAVVLGASAAACQAPELGRGVAQAAADGPITVAAVWPWGSRTMLLFGEGLQLAVDEINAAGGLLGRPVTVLREDDHESVDRGRIVAHRLAQNRDVVAVIGHMQSYVSLPAAAIYDLSGLVHVAPVATDPRLTQQGYRRLFRMTVTDRETGAQMADYAAARRYGRVAIYYIRNAYGRSLANAFEERAIERGIAIVDRQSYDPNAVVGGARRYRHPDVLGGLAPGCDLRRRRAAPGRRDDRRSARNGHRGTGPRRRCDRGRAVPGVGRRSGRRDRAGGDIPPGRSATGGAPVQCRVPAAPRRLAGRVGRTRLRRDVPACAGHRRGRHRRIRTVSQRRCARRTAGRG